MKPFTIPVLKHREHVRLCRVIRRLLVGLLVLSIFAGGPTGVRAEDLPNGSSYSTNAPGIHGIHTNLNAYPNGAVPRYEKFEISFEISTAARNWAMPFDASPPAGIQPGIGASVDALFTPDNWQTVYRQPGFPYQEYLDEVKDGKEWFYPTGRLYWKVRFAPNQSGVWQYKLTLQDTNGYAETPASAFQVVDSNNKGFLRVSQRDSRYFEYENGAYFPGLSYNMNFDHVSWNNPISGNAGNFKAMSENGIQLVRLWLSQWGIYGASWNPWNSMNPEDYGQYIPSSWLSFEQAYPGSDVSMQVSASENACMFLGFMKAAPAVKRNTNYRVRIRYKTTGMGAAKEDGQSYGFAAKTGGWLWGDGNNCYEPGTGTVVTGYQNQDTPDWQILEGRLTTGSSDFLPNFYLVMENISTGKAFVDSVWIEEDLGNGAYGPNILNHPWMAHHLYFDERNSYAFDKVLDLARIHDVYLRPVILEKNDWIFNRIDDLGSPVDDPGNDRFYGSGRSMTKVRWLQQAWWRYLQARWGYSTQIHSWELLNEGDPANKLHFILADEFGKYMRQFAPNNHMVSTSFWHSFPEDEFWSSPDYPNVDFSDYHEYYDEDDANFIDTALATYETSLQLGGGQPGGPGKPVVRGETGFSNSSGSATGQFERDSRGVWLHNFVWGGINPGGMLESYWFENQHIYGSSEGGALKFDHRPQYRAFYNFISGIPLNNGSYQDADARVSGKDLRAWGQKDLVNGSAHLWIQNTKHTWKNTVDGYALYSTSGSVELSGFQAGQSYTLEWWDPYQSSVLEQILGTETLQAQADGRLTAEVKDLDTDIAVRITRGAWAKKIFIPWVRGGR